jgi:hypothetical protein
MSKQDRQGVRTSAGLEQKYRFGKAFADQRLSINEQGELIYKLDNSLSGAERSLSSLLDGVTALEGKADNIDAEVGELEQSLSDLSKNVAPSGYGLGSANSQLIGNRDVNDIVENGWYLWNSTTGTTLNTPFGAGQMLVIARDGGRYCTQIAFEANKTTSIKVRSQGYDKTWSDWEYINPPMASGAEYRTTDRIHAKAVYKKADANGSISYRLNGETAWYPEKMGMKLLWTNENHISTFNAQTISVALSGYQWVAIRYKLGHDKDYVKTVFGAVGDTLNMDAITDSGYVGNRRAITSATNVEFEAATYSANVSNKQQYLIPLAIYGIKGVC